MGIISDIQSSLRDAFDEELSDIIVSFTLIKKKAIGDYDIASGEREVFEEQFKSRGLFDQIDTKKLSENILSTDEILIVIADEIDCKIEIDDIIVLDLDSTEYLVVSPNPVMGGKTTPIIYEIQVRKNG